MIVLDNIEQNVKFELQLVNTLLKDIDNNRSDFENWIPFTSKLITPTKSIIIDEDINAAMTVYEIKNLIKGISELFQFIGSDEKVSFDYCCSENYFSCRFDYANEDNCFIIDIWMNVAEYTKGKLYGYDEGIRFVSCNEQLRKFADTFIKDFNTALQS